MTPKEKAKELIDKFTFQCKECDYNWNAKQCALIAVNEVISVIENGNPIETQWNYWQNLKEEIEKL